VAAVIELVRLDPESDLAKRLDSANGKEIVVEANGRHFRMVEEKDRSDMWKDYDPEKLREVLLKYAGSWSDVDAEKMKRDLRTWRGLGSKPPLRWDDETDDWVLAEPIDTEQDETSNHQSANAE